MASALSVQALDMAITAKSSSDSIMGSKRPLHQMQTVDSSASVEYPSLGSSGWDSCSPGAQREHEPRGAPLTQQGTLGLHLC